MIKIQFYIEYLFPILLRISVSVIFKIIFDVATMLLKQAKILTEEQADLLLIYADSTR
jgi:hypothetical protein